MQVLVLGIVVFALVGFAFMVGRAVWQTVDQTETPKISEEYTYVATGLAGLVGGVVAVGLGQAKPGTDDPNATRSLMGSGLVSGQARDWALVIYTGVFIILGIACVVVWVQDAHPADLVKSEASVALGLLIPTAAAYFRQ
jgi:hypothetical protein